MARLINNGSKTQYDSYQEYVDCQDSRSHNYDCPNCLGLNQTNVQQALKAGIKFTKLLDVGCRDAAYFDDLTANGIECIGVDVSPTSVAYSKSKGRNVILTDVAEMSGKLPANHFDLLISNHSLEHFLDPLSSLRECYKVTAPGGYILIKLPNEGNVIKDTKYYAHVQTFNEPILRDLLTQSGFTVVHFELVTKNTEFFILGKK